MIRYYSPYYSTCRVHSLGRLITYIPMFRYSI
jgi:hypothetical protein